MTNVTINQLPSASTIDSTNDLLPIYTASGQATQSINRNTLLGLASAPVGITDSQTLTNKILTSPTINGATLSGTLSGTYTIGGTPTFPSSVVTLTGSQTLTNKVLTSPTINTPTITNASITADTLSGFTTSNNGTVYGIAVTGGTIGNAALAANAVNTTQITSGIQLPDKMKNPYKFSVYKAANQTVTASAWTKLALDTANFDTGSNFDLITNHQFTAPITGYYQLNASVLAQTVADGGTVAIGLNVNTFSSTPTYQGTTVSPGAVINPASSMSLLLKLNANDTVQLYGYTTGTVFLGAQVNTWLMGFLVSAT